MNVAVPREMACRELVELVTDYFEGALAADDAAAFEAHIEGCDACTRYLEQMRETISALGHLPPESLSLEAEVELLAVFRGWRSRR